MRQNTTEDKQTAQNDENSVWDHSIRSRSRRTRIESMSAERRTAHFERTARTPNSPNTKHFENFRTGRTVRTPTVRTLVDPGYRGSVDR